MDVLMNAIFFLNLLPNSMSSPLYAEGEFLANYAQELAGNSELTL